MRKSLTCSFICTLVTLTGCSTTPTEAVYRGSVLERLPFVYRMTVQQGNLITEEMIDSVQIGMNQRQVRYLLGTPLLQDMFHQDRWDYTYTMRRGRNPMEVKPLTLWFKDDALVRIDGYLQPDPERATARNPEEVVVSVPDWQDNRGLFTRAMNVIGLEK